MARNGVAILREIAMVKASSVTDTIKAKMLAGLNAELDEMYGQQTLPGVPTALQAAPAGTPQVGQAPAKKG